MTQLLIKVRTPDYDSWRAAYDSTDHLRRQMGFISGGEIIRSEEATDSVLLSEEWNSVEQAEAVYASGALGTTTEDIEITEEPPSTSIAGNGI